MGRYTGHSQRRQAQRAGRSLHQLPLRSGSQRQNYEYIGYNDPNTKATSLHKKDFINDPMLKMAVDEIDKGEWLTDIGDAITLYDKDWTELKTIK